LVQQHCFPAPISPKPSPRGSVLLNLPFVMAPCAAPAAGEDGTGCGNYEHPKPTDAPPN